MVAELQEIEAMECIVMENVSNLLCVLSELYCQVPFKTLKK